MDLSDTLPAGSAGDPASPCGDGRRTAPWGAATALVRANERRGPDWYALEAHAPGLAAHALPGHFAQLRVTGAEPALDPLLRRPLSFCTCDRSGGDVTFIYRVVGRGTAALARLASGQRLDLLGPLGRSFPDPARRAASERPLILVGGGLGIPPLAFAAAWAIEARRHVIAILGARSSAYLAGAEEVQQAGARVHIVTEDGSRGRTGVVTGALDEALAALPESEVWACGPSAMLAAVHGRCRARGAPCWVCVERPMACGFGACIGCAVERADGGGYLRACVDGPVFPADQVVP